MTERRERKKRREEEDERKKIERLQLLEKEAIVIDSLDYGELANSLDLHSDDVYQIVLDLAIKYKMTIRKSERLVFINDSNRKEFMDELDDQLRIKCHLQTKREKPLRRWLEFHQLVRRYISRCFYTRIRIILSRT